MSTVNFSVTDEVKAQFNATFRKQNKSAIISELMQEAVERARREERIHEAVARILARRRSAPLTTTKTLDEARKRGRP
jgi:hypothetical protein